MPIFFFLFLYPFHSLYYFHSILNRFFSPVINKKIEHNHYVYQTITFLLPPLLYHQHFFSKYPNFSCMFFFIYIYVTLLLIHLTVYIYIYYYYYFRKKKDILLLCVTHYIQATIPLPLFCT